jgi:hypothetical protein
LAFMLAFISVSMAFRNSMSSIFAEWKCKIHIRPNNRSNRTKCGVYKSVTTSWHQMLV